MILRTTFLLALLLGGLTASAQNNLFSTSTSSPTVKTNGAPQPITVDAENGGTFDMKREFAFYRGNVRVNDPQFFLRCDSLHLTLDMKANKGTNQLQTSASPSSPSPLTAAPPMGGGVGRLRQMNADGGVVFSNKVDLTQAFADHMVYFATNDTFELTGNSKSVKPGDKGTFTTIAEKILYRRSKGILETEGKSTTTFTPAETNKSSTLPAPAPKQP